MVVLSKNSHHERVLALIRHYRIIIFHTILVIALLGAVITITFSPKNLISSQYAIASAATISNFTFGAAGDWGGTSQAMTTANNIHNKGVGLVIGLGDYSYQNDSLYTQNRWWNYIMAPLHDINFTGALGNHDVSLQGLYNSIFENSTRILKNGGWVYSFNYRNVHFLALNPNESYKVGSSQYNFTRNDLALAANNTATVKWIVVFFHQPIYTSPSNHAPLEAMRDIYHPLFDKYGVDLVLQGHNHNYQRTYPLKYNATSSSNPIVTDMNQSVYEHPSGEIYAVVGTAGQENYRLDAQSPFVATQFRDVHGYLNIDIVNNGQTLKGTFFSNDETTKDSFTIDKSGVTPKH